MPKDSSYMTPLTLAGQLIMENGGETYRVEETITRMGHAFGFSEVESFAVPSGIFISYRKHDGEIETAVKRVRRGATNLTRVDAVNAISRQMEQETLSCEEVTRRLEQIRDVPPYVKRPGILLATALSSGGWTLMFGGGAVDFVVAFFAVALVQLVAILMDRFHMQTLVATLAGSFLATFVPLLMQRWTGLLVVDATIAGGLMPMLPGLAMTNAVQDTMRGDMVSGLSSAASAILTAVLVAGGAVMGQALYNLLVGGGLL